MTDLFDENNLKTDPRERTRLFQSWIFQSPNGFWHSSDACASMQKGFLLRERPYRKISTAHSWWCKIQGVCVLIFQYRTLEMPHVWGPLKCRRGEMGFALCGVGEDDGVERDEGEWAPILPLPSSPRCGEPVCAQNKLTLTQFLCFGWLDLRRWWCLLCHPNGRNTKHNGIEFCDYIFCIWTCKLAVYSYNLLFCAYKQLAGVWSW